MPIYELNGVVPVIPDTTFVHPTAVIIGDVILGERVYIGPNASLRGDFGRLVVETGANIQDNCVLHGFPDQETRVEQDGHIGHGAVLHGCTIQRNALVGINSVILDGAIIGENCVVGAGSLVTANSQFDANGLILGSPAKWMRALRPDEIEWKSLGTREYQALAANCLQHLHETLPLQQAEENRPWGAFAATIAPKKNPPI